LAKRIVGIISTCEREFGKVILRDVIFATHISLAGVPTVAASGILGKMDISFPYHGILLLKDIIQFFRDRVKEILFQAIQE
jgi:hypothetical protein